MIDSVMFNLSRVYGHFGAKAQKYSLVNPAGLPGRLKFLWHAYRITLILFLVFLAMLCLQNLVIFWCAFVAAIVSLYIKGIIEEKLDRGLLELMVKEKEDERNSETHPV